MAPDSEIVLRLLLGALLGGIIGFERQHHGRPAGFRTHLLVCTASVLVMIISQYFAFRLSVDPSYVRVDPGRIAAGAITGIGFLGAGVIVKAGVNVHGLTTAACLWIVAAIGLALGSGLYLAAGLTFVITFLALWLLERLERLVPSRHYHFLSVTIEPGGENEKALLNVVRGHGAAVKGRDCAFNREKNESSYGFTVTLRDEELLSPLVREVRSLPFVKNFTLRT
jgi:putative Mg2+ transporter-C (MgtC) family protein